MVYTIGKIRIFQQVICGVRSGFTFSFLLIIKRTLDNPFNRNGNPTSINPCLMCTNTHTITDAPVYKNGHYIGGELRRQRFNEKTNVNNKNKTIRWFFSDAT